ncbi:MAG TPA: S8 family serine peptidase [Candidatus Polarisedimenticolia bacterium]|jgi:serine protease AprX|nr:S8 family serine peptidase [Candidatus Polarisedimenticolia bacterium]
MDRSSRQGKRILAIIAAFLIVLPAANASGAQGGTRLSGEVEAKIRAAGADDLIPVIIQTVGEPTTGHFARLHGRGGAVKSRHLAIRGYSARVPASQLAALADDPEIEHVSFDTPVKAHMDVAYRSVRADLAGVASGGLDGRGVGIALVDTGATGHRDLLRPKGAPQVVEVEVVGHENGLADYFGHGTHVAGILNGNGAASSDPPSFRTFKGMAPGAQLISIRSLHPDGTGVTSDIIAAIDWAVRFKTAYNIRVMNLSLGHPVYESYKDDPLCRAVRNAYDNGIVVVVAAGNDGAIGSGFGTITSPGNEPTAVTVGAMDDADTVATSDDVLGWYSSKGPTLIDYVVKPDLVAPGTSIVSLRAAGSYIDATYPDQALRLSEYKIGTLSGPDRVGDYLVLSGTSMAAPMVAGTAALMLQKDPSLTAATVKARLMKAAAKDKRLIFETGAGYLDVEVALLATGTAKSGASPLAMLASDGNVYIEDTGLIWGNEFTLSIVWGGGTKGGLDGIGLLDVPESIVSVYGGIWGGRGGTHSLLENNMITASGLIWAGDRCSLDSASGSLDILGGIWGGGKRP